LKAGLPDFSLVRHAQTGKIFQTTFNMYQIAIKKFTQSWIFGLKIYHPATLLQTGLTCQRGQ
jgi:hypothetical protein